MYCPCFSSRKCIFAQSWWARAHCARRWCVDRGRIARGRMKAMKWTLLSVALAAESTYYPRCSCDCCAVAGSGDQLSCQLSRGDKCDTWLDANFMPIDCNPATVWPSFHTDPAPESIGHNEFCSTYCKADVMGPGEPCLQLRSPFAQETPECCPCAGKEDKWPLLPTNAPTGTVVVQPPPPVFLAMVRKASCSSACCKQH